MRIDEGAMEGDSREVERLVYGERSVGVGGGIGEMNEEKKEDYCINFSI